MTFINKILETFRMKQYHTYMYENHVTKSTFSRYGYFCDQNNRKVEIQVGNELSLTVWSRRLTTWFFWGIPGWRLHSRLTQFHFHCLQNQSLIVIKYLIYICQVQAQISSGEACQLWIWLSLTGSFATPEIFITDKITTTHWKFWWQIISVVGASLCRFYMLYYIHIYVSFSLS